MLRLCSPFLKENPMCPFGLAQVERFELSRLLHPIGFQDRTLQPLGYTCILARMVRLELTRHCCPNSLANCPLHQLEYIRTSGSEEPDAYVLKYAAIFNCRFVEQIVTPVVLRVSLLSGTAIHIHIHTQTLRMRELSGSRTRIHNIVAIFPLNHQLIKRTEHIYNSGEHKAINLR